MAKGREVLTLDIEFTPSLALYIWQSFRQGLKQVVSHVYDVMDIWIIAAEVCSTQGCIAASMVNSLAFLPSMLAVNPFKTLAVNRLLYETPRGPLDLNILPQVEPLAQSLLLFAQLLAVVAAEHKSISASTTAGTVSTEDQELIRNVTANRLQELTDVSCCTPVLLSDPTAQRQTCAPQPLPTPSKRVVLLRSAVLVLKLATMTFNVKADLVGHADTQMPMSVQALWATISALANSISVAYSLDASTCPSLLVSMSSSKEEHVLCSLLVEHLVAALRQGLKEPQAAAQKLACLLLLSATLHIMHPDLVRHEIKRLGKGSDVWCR